ncbi:MAG: hypothetical protein AAFX99_15885, partial [Myxococcota bacterium]
MFIRIIVFRKGRSYRSERVLDPSTSSRGSQLDVDYIVQKGSSTHWLTSQGSQLDVDYIVQK